MSLEKYGQQTLGAANIVIVPRSVTSVTAIVMGSCTASFETPNRPDFSSSRRATPRELHRPAK